MSLLSKCELRVFDSASISGSWQTFGAVIGDPAYQVVVSNESDVSVQIGIDNSTAIIRVSPGQVLPLTYYSRHNTQNLGSYLFKKGTQFYIKQVSAAGTGDIILNILETQAPS